MKKKRITFEIDKEHQDCVELLKKNDIIISDVCRQALRDMAYKVMERESLLNTMKRRNNG